MSEGSAEGPKEDPNLQETPIERGPDLAVTDEEKTRRRQEAEKAREAALAVEAAQANQREIAALVERNHAYIEHAVEMAKINAKIKADRERIDIPTVPDGSSKRRDPLVKERKAVASVTVGLVIALILLVSGLIVGGIYYLFSQNNPIPNAPGTPGEVVSVDPPTAGAVGGNKAEDKTHAKPAVNSANLSGGALPGNGDKSTADSDTHIEGNIVSPDNPPETDKETEIDDSPVTDKESQKKDPQKFDP